VARRATSPTRRRVWNAPATSPRISSIPREWRRQGGRTVRQRLRELVERHDVDRLVVIGHSMGGVVAKALLDEIDVDDDLPSWRLFISISAPFGIDTAQYAHQLPQHPAAWDDLVPNSSFMRKVQSTPFPSDLRFYLFFGARSSNRLMRALGNNDGVLSIDSMCGSPVTDMAADVFGSYEDHTSILAAPLVWRRLEGVLNAELGRQSASGYAAILTRTGPGCSTHLSARPVAGRRPRPAGAPLPGRRALSPAAVNRHPNAARIACAPGS
jgi:hypothetical protein